MEFTATSLSEYLQLIKDEIGHSSHGNLSLYRGHRDINWELTPGITRYPFVLPDAICKKPIDETGGDYPRDESAERRLLIVFYDHATPIFPQWVWSGTEAEIRWKQFIVAQHYGLPTRLLDWSSNPLVALFFALEGEASKRSEDINDESCEFHDSKVYILKVKESFSTTSLARRNIEPPLYKVYSDRFKIGIIRPPDIDGRVTAQSSYLSITEDSTVPIEPDFSIRIPFQARKNMRRELDHADINRKKLFPDLEGLTAYLKWNVTFREKNPGVEKSKS
jgi:hypothetical protein